MKSPRDQEFQNNLVDFLEKEERESFFSFKKILILFFAVFFILGFAFSYHALSSGGRVFGKKRSFFSQMKRLVFSENKTEMQKQEQINILLLGMRGTGHKNSQGGGTYLSDTNIIIFLRPAEKKIALLSIPRDLLVDTKNFGKRKINSVYALNLQKYKNEEKAASSTIKVFEKTLDIPLNYYIKVDFAGFEKIIDILGGIDINIEQSFTDAQYPTADYGYQIIKFEKGVEHMNGDRALKFARSRHGNNGEGSDFARARRQQKIITAVKDKVFSFGTLLNPIKINRLIASLGDHVRTDMELEQALALFKIFSNIPSDQILNKVIDNSSNGLLTSTKTAQGAYVLIPKKGAEDFSDIQHLAQTIFENQ